MFRAPADRNERRLALPLPRARPHELLLSALILLITLLVARWIAGGVETTAARRVEQAQWLEHFAALRHEARVRWLAAATDHASPPDARWRARLEQVATEAPPGYGAVVRKLER